MTGNTSALNVGYVGLGVMGGALAQRLLLSRPLKVFDLNAQSVSALVEAGATYVESLEELAAQCDVVMLCLPRSSDVRKVIFSSGGLAAGLKRGTIIVDQTSGDPTETRKIAVELDSLGVHMIDAPVSGGPGGAKAGTIAIMAGGDSGQLARIRPIFEQISPNIFECGEIGAGQVMKLINNTISTCNRFAMLEAVAMGRRNGLDLQVMTDVLNAGGARSKATENMLPAMVKGRTEGFFLLSLMLKDLNLASDLAIESGVPLQFGQMARAMLQTASNIYGPDANFLDIPDLVAMQAGINFKDGIED